MESNCKEKQQLAISPRIQILRRIKFKKHSQKREIFSTNIPLELQLLSAALFPISKTPYQNVTTFALAANTNTIPLEELISLTKYNWNLNYDFDIITAWHPQNKEGVKMQSKTNPEEPLALKKEVFISHGKDLKPLNELKAMLVGFGLSPVVLSEQPSGGKTVMEKLEAYSDVGFAFVILTPDDLGGFVEMGSKWSRPQRLRKFLKTAYPRPRQNVILEFGFFVGRLGRDRVACLLKKPVEQPSDMHGIVYLSFKESLNEMRAEILKELEAAGYELPNNAIST